MAEFPAQEWDLRTNSCKYIQYGIDTRWNSTYRMITDAIGFKAPLNDTCDDHTELEDLKLDLVRILRYKYFRMKRLN
jgi:hypothetical protein